MRSELQLELGDLAATERLGVALGQRLRPGQVLALTGDLGAGKTTLVRALARGLGVAEPAAVCSPTYLLVVEHAGPVPLLHADAYLPAKLHDFLAEGGSDYLLDARAVVAVEWAERVADLLPAATLWLELAVAGPQGRRARLHTTAGEAFPWLAELAKICAGD
jgi:tRNA threonylcarbamoyl adenosine modification protein YjeE